MTTLIVLVICLNTLPTTVGNKLFILPNQIPIISKKIK